MISYKKCSESALKAQEDGWILVGDHLPMYCDEVEVLGRNFNQSEVALHTATFDPTSGWKGVSRVYAWRLPSCTLKMLREKHPKRFL